MDSWNWMSKVPLHVIDNPAGEKFRIVNSRRFFPCTFIAFVTRHAITTNVFCGSLFELRVPQVVIAGILTREWSRYQGMNCGSSASTNHAFMRDKRVEISSSLHVSRRIFNMGHYLVPFLVNSICFNVDSEMILVSKYRFVSRFFTQEGLWQIQVGGGTPKIVEIDEFFFLLSCPKILG